MTGLVLISTEDVPQEVKTEDAISEIVAAVKYHLMLNFLALHSPRLGHLHRSQEGEFSLLILHLEYSLWQCHPSACEQKVNEVWLC